MWHSTDQTIIDNAIVKSHKRPRASMRAKGGHYDYDNIQPYDKRYSVFVKYDTIFFGNYHNIELLIFAR